MLLSLPFQASFTNIIKSKSLSPFLPSESNRTRAAGTNKRIDLRDRLDFQRDSASIRFKNAFATSRCPWRLPGSIFLAMLHIMAQRGFFASSFA